MKLMKCALYIDKKAKGLLMSMLYLRDMKKLPVSKQTSAITINHNENIKKYFVKLATIFFSLGYFISCLFEDILCY